MNLLIENIILFIVIFFGLKYLTLSPNEDLNKKIMMFFLIISAFIVINLVVNIINRIMVPINELLSRAFIIGIIGILRYYIYLDLVNSKIITFTETNKNIYISLSIVGANILFKLIKLFIDTT